MTILGIDIGGSGIKGAPVDIEQGAPTTAYCRIATPRPATPEAVCAVVVDLVKHFGWHGPIGCTFPAVIKAGVAYSAANIDPGWVGKNTQDLFQQATGCPVHLMNDADAAGIAEVAFGAGKDQPGVIMLLTFGTGIGSALIFNGQLVPNTEFGHLKIRGKDAEHRASEHARTTKNLSWKKWAAAIDEYLQTLEQLFSPNLFIVGGGISKKHEKFLPLLTVQTPVVPAKLLNEAGIVGAALAARSLLPAPTPPSAAHPRRRAKVSVST